MVKHMGNPGPVGLMAFAFCIFMLGLVKAEWVESGFVQLLTAFGFWWGGGGQVVVGLLELLHGNSFGALIFFTYGSLWLALSTCWFYQRQNEYNILTFGGSSHSAEAEQFGYVSTHHYKNGETIMLSMFAFATLFFFVVSLRKNRCLQSILLTLLVSLSFAAAGEHSHACKIIGGVGNMLTGCVVFYSLAAEIVNEEWGYDLLPGLKSCVTPKTTDNLETIFSYDKAQGVFLNLSGMQFLSQEVVDKFEATLDAKFAEINKRVNVVVNYQGVEIGASVKDKYAEAISRLESKYYLSVQRFSATAFRDVTKLPQRKE